jgi:hypothetical protein
MEEIPVYLLDDVVPREARGSLEARTRALNHLDNATFFEYTILLWTVILVAAGLIYYYFDIISASVFSFVVSGTASHCLLYLHRNVVSKRIVKGLDYFVLVTAVLGLAGIFDLNSKLADLGVQRAKSALVQKSTEIQTFLSEWNVPCVTIREADRARSMARNNLFGDDRKSRVLECELNHISEDCDYHLNMEDGPGLFCVLVHHALDDFPSDGRLEHVPFLLEMIHYDHGPYVVFPPLRQLSRMSEEYLDLYKSSLGESSKEGDVALHIRGLSFVLIAFGLGIRLTKTTAETLEWHT